MARKLNETRLRHARKAWEPFDADKRPRGTLFTHLASAIASQQLSTKAADTIYGRFKALFPRKTPTPSVTLELTVTQLRGAGLSGAKVLAIQDLARKTLEGLVPTDAQARKMSDDELVERLIAVRGVGRWTVEMVLIFRYRRMDVWPVDDLGVRKGFKLLFPEARFTTARELAPLGDQWAGNRTEIAWYCWRALEAQATEKKNTKAKK